MGTTIDSSGFDVVHCNTGSGQRMAKGSLSHATVVRGEGKIQIVHFFTLFLQEVLVGFCLTL